MSVVVGRRGKVDCHPHRSRVARPAVSGSAGGREAVWPTPARGGVPGRELDGPGALVHLDDILSIDAIDAIQWVPGAGNAPQIEWMDLLKRIQKAGKSLYIGCSPDELPVYHKELRPEKVFYDVCGVPSQSEADALLDWLRANT